MSNLAQHITDAEFPATIASGVTLVDFWAPWCGPCRAIAPILDELAGELQGKAKIVKINIDDQPQAAADHGIMAVPTLLVFKDGKKVAQRTGAHQTKREMLAFIQQAL